ncbi:MAG: anthranilate phosphoribosyltransferase [Candidatus Ancillula sp.]|jgi:anthranilate phosphoribosyltransferase|nr:anthranilate phosphoribosyltransferase [Candidatus Ancillula sp.]
MKNKNNWETILHQLLNRDDLTKEQAKWVMIEIMTGQATDAKLGAVLALLAQKGERTPEIEGFAEGMIEHAVPLEGVGGETLDIVGTGGDHVNSVNISTMASVVIASCGIKVLKHGNRASSSMSGSADVLGELGLNLDLSPKDVARVANDAGISFAFAQTFHPAMKYSAPIRKDLAIHTVFNLLGPLTNPGRPEKVVIGVADEKYARLIAEVFASRGEEGFVFNVFDDNGTKLDELAAAVHGDLYEIRDGKISLTDFDPEAMKKTVGLETIAISDLRGGSPEHNAEVAREVFRGVGSKLSDSQSERAIYQTVILNAAAGIVADGKLIPVELKSENDPFANLVERLSFAYKLASESVISGKTEEKLNQWVKESNR